MKQTVHYLGAIAAAFFFLLQSATAETILGRVVGVSDGDTVTLLTAEKKRVKVRLFGIDAPESKQAFGQVAKKSLSDLAFDKEAKIVTVNTDRYGREVAWLYVGDLCANEEQISRGLAWWYRSYAKHEKRLQQLQEEATEAKRGLWSDANPIPPWEWRKTEHEQRKVGRN